MTHPVLDSPWMVVPEVMAYARSGRREVIQALNDGSLDGYQSKVGGKWRVHRDAVDAWVRGEAAPAPKPLTAPRRAS